MALDSGGAPCYGFHERAVIKARRFVSPEKLHGNERTTSAGVAGALKKQQTACPCGSKPSFYPETGNVELKTWMTPRRIVGPKTQSKKAKSKAKG
jgi:hypothetical protein